MKKLANYFLTFFAVFFAIPTVLILASWEAIPGQFLYPVKGAFEDIALSITTNTPIASALSIEFTGRRYTEATKLLDQKGSSAGYTLLVAEAKATQAIVEKNGDTGAKRELIQKIEEYQSGITQTKTTYNAKAAAPTTTKTTATYPSQPTTTTVSEGVPGGSGGTKVTVNVPVTITIKEEKPEEVVQNLETTTTELETIKEEVKKSLPESANENAVQNTNKEKENNGQGQENGNSEGKEEN